MKQLMDEDMIPKMNIKELENCTICKKTKSTQQPVKQRTSPRTNDLLQMLHIDIDGPFPILGRNGERFKIEIVDDFSGFCAIFTEGTKRECASHIPEYIEWAENMTGKRVKELRTDNAPELTQGAVGEHCRQKGIEITTSPPYRPAINGTAERRHRTTNQMITAMLNDMQMDECLWPDAAAATAFITNRTPNKKSEPLSPYEIFTGRRPNLTNLKVFGSKAWVNRPAARRHGFSVTADEATLIGFTKTAYVLLRSDGQIVESVDVKFEENSPPPHEEEDTTEFSTTESEDNDNDTNSNLDHSANRTAEESLDNGTQASEIGTDESPYISASEDNRTEEISESEERDESEKEKPIGMTLRSRQLPSAKLAQVFQGGNS